MSPDNGPTAPEDPAPPHPALRTAFCELVGIRFPVVQTGMGWVAGPAWWRPRPKPAVWASWLRPP